MPRIAKIAPGGMVFRSLHRGAGRMTRFKKDRDFDAFEHIIPETLRQVPIRIGAHCLLPSHWHCLLSPERDGDLAAFMQRITNTHVQRWQQRYH